MAKASKKPSAEAREPKAEPSNSVLAAAAAALEEGDVLTARHLAQAVISGKKGPREDQAATTLAKQYSTDDSPIGDLPEHVAQELVNRTHVPFKAYLYGAICLVVFSFLLALARTRYA